MTVFVWVFAIMWVITVCVAFVLFELLHKALQENIVLEIKANAPRITCSPDDTICHMRFADGTEYDVKRKDITPKDMEYAVGTIHDAEYKELAK